MIVWHKARIAGRYIVELKVHEVGKSAKNSDGGKYGLICKDLKTGRRVLLDNHHPKGPHIHLDEEELLYAFKNLEALVDDFQALVLQHLEVKL